MHRSQLSWLALVVAIVTPHAAHASSFAGAAGVESFQAIGGSGSRAVLGMGAADLGSADALAQAVRYEDAIAGAGWSFTAGGSARLSGPLRARVRATRVLGEAGFRAWQWRAGPEWRFGERATLGAFYERDAAGDSAHTQGIVGEGLLALTPKLTARAAASWATGDAASRIAQASVGGIWRAAPHLALIADAGWLSTQGTSQTTFPIGGGGGGLPILGGASRTPGTASRTSVTQSTAPTLLLGARVIFP
jgi:hypothetical protein